MEYLYQQALVVMGLIVVMFVVMVSAVRLAKNAAHLPGSVVYLLLVVNIVVEESVALVVQHAVLI